MSNKGAVNFFLSKKMGGGQYFFVGKELFQTPLPRESYFGPLPPSKNNLGEFLLKKSDPFYFYYFAGPLKAPCPLSI